MRSAGPTLDLVVPVFNEEAALEGSVRRLAEHLETLPFSARVSIVDNASTDGTWRLAQRLAAELPAVQAMRLEQKGRGRALRAAWTASDADIVAYTDVDLSTDIRALQPLVDAVRDGADLAIGSRLAPGATVTRGARRELVSRSYNNIVKAVTKAGFSDAQCGFKAVRADVARTLLPEVENENWFFDTELLLLAEHRGLRIAEVPVEWVDDPTSTVDIVATATEDLRGLLRLTRRLLGQRVVGVSGLQRAVVSFAVVGSCTTLLHLGLLAALRGSLGSLWANLVALAVATPVNTALNRRSTFGYRGRHRLARDHAEAGVVLLGGLAATSLALLLVDSLWVVLVANGTVTVLRFLLLRAWVFHPGRRRTA